MLLHGSCFLEEALALFIWFGFLGKLQGFGLRTVSWVWGLGFQEEIGHPRCTLLAQILHVA